MNIKKIFEPVEGKPLLNRNIIERRFNMDSKYLLIPLLLAIFFLINRRYFMYGFLTIFSAVFSFYHDKVNRTPIDLKMPLFIGMFITREYGLLFTFIFFIISDLLPSLVAGGQMDGTSLLFIGWYFVVNALVLMFPSTQLTVLGPLLVIVEALGSVFIKSLFGYPGIVAVATTIMSVLVRIIYFLTLGEILQLIFSTL